MNVTLKLPDDLCRQARHRAIDESKSLSAWVAEVVREKLEASPKTASTLIERLGATEFLDRDIPLPDRKGGSVREIQFD